MYLINNEYQLFFYNLTILLIKHDILIKLQSNFKMEGGADHLMKSLDELIADDKKNRNENWKSKK